METGHGLRERVLEVHGRLCEAYGCPVGYFHSLDPVSELVSTMLNHRTTNRQGGQAFRALRARYGSWEAVRDAPTAEVEATIPMVTWPEQKAPRIQDVLRRITEECGSLDLGFLAEMPVEEARAWLERFPGVGPKTSAAVLSFSTIRAKALPVDSHHHRVAQRLGFVGPKVDVGPSHKILENLLPEEWNAQEVYDHHEILMFHGQRVCRPYPECRACVLNDLCPSRRAPADRESLDRESEARRAPVAIHR